MLSCKEKQTESKKACSKENMQHYLQMEDLSVSVFCHKGKRLRRSLLGLQVQYVKLNEAMQAEQRYAEEATPLI